MFGILARSSRTLVTNPYGLAAVLVVVAAAAGMGYWRRAEIIYGSAAARGAALGTLGMGVVPAGIWLAAVVVVLDTKPGLLRHFKLWAGAAVFVLALIGALSFFRPDGGILAAFTTDASRTLGGSVGEAIAGSGTALQIVRVSTVFLVGCIIVSPAGMWKLAGWAARGLVYLYLFLAIVVSAFGSLASRIFKRKRPEPSAEPTDSISETSPPSPEPPEAPAYTPKSPAAAPAAAARSGGMLSRILRGDSDLRTSAPAGDNDPDGAPALAQAAAAHSLPDPGGAPALAQAAAVQSLTDPGGAPALAQAAAAKSLADPGGIPVPAQQTAMTPFQAAAAVMTEDRDALEALPAGNAPRALAEARLGLPNGTAVEDGVRSLPSVNGNGNGLAAISLPQPPAIKHNRFWQEGSNGNGHAPQEPMFDPGEPDEEAGDPVEAIEQEPVVAAWDLPGMELLVDANEGGISHEDMAATARTITGTLADYGVEAEIGEVSPGPTVTMYGLVPGWVRKYKHVRVTDENGNPKRDESGRPVMSRVETRTRVKVGSIISREKDLSLALMTPSLRIETPVMGKALVGIEVPNPKSSLVTLRNLMQTREFEKLRKSAKLPIAFGKGSGGETMVVDLAKMPHLLVAGATGSGKSVFINTVISCLLMEKTPEDIRLLLVDPKRVELTPYNGIPHLLTPVVTETDQVVGLLKGLIREMSDRYRKMEDIGVRNIDTYNKKMPDKMPYLVVAIDELADLMMTASFDVEQSLCRLAQLGRATGIHLVVATQRPSVDVITGLIKANFPSRVSFGLTSQVDSRTILDTAGAERLLGRGDMLYLAADAARPERVQGVFISDREVDDVAEFWRTTPRGPIPTVHLHSMGDGEQEESEDEDDGDEVEQRDALLDKAIELAYTQKKLSTSLLQRKLRIGYPRAARLMDQLEEEGIVGPSDGSKSRDVIIGGM